MPSEQQKHEPTEHEPEYLCRIVTCRQVQDGPNSTRPVHGSIDVRSETLWHLLREQGGYVIAAHIA